MALYAIDNRPAPIDFESGFDDVIKMTLQNAKNLLMTRMGEVPYDRQRGFDAKLMDLPIDKLRQRIVAELDRLMMWEPDVEVSDAEVSLDSNGEIYIRVILDIDIDE